MAGGFEYGTELLGSIEEGNSPVAERLLPSAARISVAYFGSWNSSLLNIILKVPVFRCILLETY